MSITLSQAPGIKPKKSKATKAQGDLVAKRGLLVSVIIGSVVVHAIAGILLGIFWIIQAFHPPEAVFEVPPQKITIPTQTPEHKMNMAQHEAMTPKPTFSERLVSTTPTDFALPPLPEVDMDQMLPLDPSELVSDQVSSLVGASGLGSGSGAGLLGSGGSGTGMSFFGVEAEGSRIVLLFDVSLSVVNKANAVGLPLERIQEETLKLIDGLPVDSRFSLVQFTQNYKAFSEELLVASAPNKEAAREWVENQWVSTGSMSGRSVTSNPQGLLAVLDLAYSMDPDLIFLISDGSFHYRPTGGIVRIPHDELGDRIRMLQAGLTREAPLHFIGFQMRNEDEREWSRMVRRTGGKIRAIR
jgi:hypothetical protein